MKTPQKLAEESRNELQEAILKAKTKSDLQRMQCLMLNEIFNATIPETALATGLAEGTVRKIRCYYFKGGISALNVIGRSGGNHRNLTTSEEDKLLEPFFRQAAEGGVLVANEIKTAYEKQVGHSVPKSTIYRILERHGWRKIAPRRQHPKVDINKQEEFKKTSRNH